jgi:thioesterase domain-containing protein
LAILDTGPGDRGWSSRGGHRTKRLLALLRNLPHWFVEDALHSSPRDLLQRSKRHVRSVVRHWWTRWHGGLPVEALEDAFDHVDEIPTQNRQLMETLWRSFCDYRPKPYAGRVTLFRARTRALFDSSAADLGWSRFAEGGVEIRIIPGHHESMLQEPHVRQLAATLEDALSAARIDRVLQP